MKQTAVRMEWHRRLAGLPDGLSLREMSERLGQAYASVAFWAKLMRYGFVPQRRGRKSTIDWDSADWSKRNCDIARQFGVSGERVRQIRQARNLPPTPRLSNGGILFRQFLRRNRRRLDKWSIRQMIAESGAAISIGTAHFILKQFRERPDKR
jgi:hypothetical protein